MTEVVDVDLLAELRTGDWLDAQTFPPLSWIVPGMVPEGMTVMAGGPKIGKSWVSLDLALATATGGLALGCIPVDEPRDVLLLALEDGDRRLQERCRTLLGSATPIPERLNYMTVLAHGMVVPVVEEWLSRSKCSAPLVILDTLGKVMPPAMPGESAYQRDYRVAGRLKRICDSRPGMALVVIHHDRKAHSEDFVDGISGTNGIAGAADTLVIVNRPRTETTGRFKVTGRDVEECEYVAHIDGGQWLLEGGSLYAAAKAARETPETDNLGDRSSELLKLVHKRGEAGTRAADVASAMGMNTDDARRYLNRLADAGRIVKAARGLYTPRVTTVPGVLLEFPRQDSRDGQDTSAEDGIEP